MKEDKKEKDKCGFFFKMSFIVPTLLLLLTRFLDEKESIISATCLIMTLSFWCIIEGVVGLLKILVKYIPTY